MRLKWCWNVNKLLLEPPPFSRKVTLYGLDIHRRSIRLQKFQVAHVGLQSAAGVGSVYPNCDWHVMVEKPTKPVVEEAIGPTAVIKGTNPYQGAIGSL